MKDYNRWTDKEHKYKGCVDCTYRNCQYCDDIVEYEKEAYNRLCDLEDKIENGTLKFMPCKVGDMLYEVIEGMPIQEWKVESISFNRAYPNGVIWAARINGFGHWKFWTEDCGTKWFTDKAEAGAKLRELKEKENEQG